MFYFYLFLFMNAIFSPATPAQQGSGQVTTIIKTIISIFIKSTGTGINYLEVHKSGEGFLQLIKKLTSQPPRDGCQPLNGTERCTIFTSIK